MADLRPNIEKIREVLAERECSEREMARQMEVAYSCVGSRAIAGFLLAGFGWDEIFEVMPDQPRPRRG